jgi:hypothetical protein
MWSGVIVSKATLPAQSVLLWQPPQEFSSSAQWAESGDAAGAGVAARTGVSDVAQASSKASVPVFRSRIPQPMLRVPKPDSPAI